MYDMVAWGVSLILAGLVKDPPSAEDLLGRELGASRVPGFER